MRRLPVLSLLTACLIGGCAAEPPAGEAASAPPQFVDETRNITVDLPSLPTAPPAPGERTLDAAPVLRLGEWWKIRLTDHFSGTSYDLMRVVAGTERGNYLVGFPLDAFSNDALVMHMPGYGDILSDLSYGAHDVPFVPVRFPIVAEDTWTTAWEAEGATLDMVVEEVRSDGTATILGAPTGSGGFPTTIEYDASIGEVRRLVMEGYAEYEVLDHGYGYEGDVRVPHAHDLVFLNGRAAGVHDIRAPLTDPSPAAPVESIEVPEGYDRLSFAIILFDIAAAAGAPTSPGVYDVELTAPDGTVYADSYSPADGGWIKASFYGHEAPAGTWSLRAVAGGVGGAMVEGIGYHSIDVQLPSGCVLASANAQHHGTLCKAS